MSENKTHWKTMFDYKWLGAYCLPNGKDIVLTIKEIHKQEIINHNGKKEELPVCYFVEAVKPMIVGKTNNRLITKALGSPFHEDWIGKQIQIYATLVEAFGEKTDSIRVRPFAPKPMQPEKLTVETGTAVWNNIVKLIQQGRKVEEAQTKYIFTKEQVRELMAVQNSRNDS